MRICDCCGKEPPTGQFALLALKPTPPFMKLCFNCIEIITSGIEMQANLKSISYETLLQYADMNPDDLGRLNAEEVFVKLRNAVFELARIR